MCLCAHVCCCFSGTLHIGDEIREINGISVANQTVEQLQKMLVCVCVRESVCVCVCVCVCACVRETAEQNTSARDEDHN